MESEKFPLSMVIFVVMAIAIAVTAWMTRYSVKPQGGNRALNTIVIQDRWTGEVAFIVPYPTIRTGSEGGYKAAALFSMQQYKADRRRWEARQARREAEREAEREAAKLETQVEKTERETAKLEALEEQTSPRGELIDPLEEQASPRGELIIPELPQERTP